MQQIVDLLFRASVVIALPLAAVSLAQLWMRRGSASLRHAAWTTALTVSLLVPLWLAVAPSVLPGLSAPRFSSETTLPPANALLTIGKYSITVAGDRAPDLAPWLLSLYCAGVALAGWRYFAGLSKLSAMRKRATVHSPGVWLSPEIGVPVVFGLRSPSILLPANATAWPAERVDLALRHEQAHIVRGDLYSNAIAALTTAVYWFHPLAWYAAFRLRRECEFAADDLVLSRTSQPADYAEGLLTMARSRWSAPAAAIAMAAPSQLEGRVVAILDPLRKRTPASKTLWAGLGLSLLLMVLPFGNIQPVYAQSQTLSGVVRDAIGVVPGAELTLTPAGGGAEAQAISAGDGSYSFPSQAAGLYSLAIRKPGFDILRINGLQIWSDRPFRLDHYLRVGRIQETIQVQAEAGNPAAQPAPSGPPQRIRIGGNIQASKLIYQAKPAYPVAMKQQGIEGPVYLTVVIGKLGDVISTEVRSAPAPELAASARDAVQQWRYQPTLLNGDPVEVTADVLVNYTLAR